MARLIQKSGYFKGGSGVGYMRYVAQREGVEITSEVADSDQSIILQQVENGVAVRMAVLYLLAAKRH